MTASLWLRRLIAAPVGLASGLLSLSAGAATQPQSVTPSEAPVAWVRYAETATQNITQWLQEDGGPATAFRAYLHQTRPDENQPTPPLVLKIWIDPDGHVGRTEFTPFAHEQANADLRAALSQRTLPSPPPRGMLLPLRIAIQLDAPQPAPTTGTAQ